MRNKREGKMKLPDEVTVNINNMPGYNDAPDIEMNGIILENKNVLSYDNVARNNEVCITSFILSFSEKCI